jgi:hypothetical protein
MSVDFTGVWKADLSQSKLLGAAPKAMIMTIAYSEPDLRQEIVVTRPDGGEQRLTFQCQTSGEPDQCLLDGQPVRGTARWEGEELIIEIWLLHGTQEVYLCDCWSLSPNRQTLTMEHRNDALAGQITVLEKMASSALD